ncbi:MAG: mechanosensitive ion channel [Verrucomicrobia bacterium]|nr:mechanosensitive ion channel [Verrucomicrobiota bacterium]
MHQILGRFADWLVQVLNHPVLRHGQLTWFDIIDRLLHLVALMLFVVAADFVLRRYFLRRFLRRTRLEPQTQYAISRLVGYVFLAVGFFVSLEVAQINLSSLTVIAGAVGVGVGFGLQNLISNFISGLIILAERPVAIEDRIEVAGVVGRVTHISLRSTTVVTTDNIAIIVPNSHFITNTVTNWSHKDPKVRLRLPIGVAYGTDPEQVRRLLLEVAAEHAIVLSEPAPEVFFSEFADSSLNFELAVWIKDLTWDPRRFRSELNFAMESKFRAHGIEIPFPQRDVHVRSGALVLQAPAPAKP